MLAVNQRAIALDNIIRSDHPGFRNCSVVQLFDGSILFRDNSFMVKEKYSGGSGHWLVVFSEHDVPQIYDTDDLRYYGQFRNSSDDKDARTITTNYKSRKTLTIKVNEKCRVKIISMAVAKRQILKYHKKTISDRKKRYAKSAK